MELHAAVMPPGLLPLVCSSVWRASMMRRCTASFHAGLGGALLLAASALLPAASPLPPLWLSDLSSRHMLTRPSSRHGPAQALTVVVGEGIYSRRQHKSATDAAATAIFFFLDGVQVGFLIACGTAGDAASRCHGILLPPKWGTCG